jgi:hypothetical protein
MQPRPLAPITPLDANLVVVSGRKMKLARKRHMRVPEADSIHKRTDDGPSEFALDFFTTIIVPVYVAPDAGSAQ